MKFEATRNGITKKVKIAGEEFYLTVNFLPNGDVGEFFIKSNRYGTGQLLEMWAIAVSKGLRNGVPLQKYTNIFSYQKNIRPAGATSDPELPTCSSVIDYFARRLALYQERNKQCK